MQYSTALWKRKGPPGEVIAPPWPEALKEHGHHGLAILPQGIAPAGQAPVIDQRPLAQGIDPDHLAHRHVPPQLPPLLALEDDLPQELIIGPIVVQQVLESPG